MSVGVQSWSFGLRTFGTTPPQLTDLQTLAANIASQNRQQCASLAGVIFGSSTSWTGVDVYYYPTVPGHAAMSASADFSPVINPTTGDNLPQLCALVVSLRTPMAGRSGRGRVYLPFTRVAALEQGGQVGTVALKAAADAFQDLAIHLNGTVAGVLPGYSRLSVISGTHGMGTQISRFVIDSKVDVQRRREDKLSPVYTESRPAIV